MAVVPEQGIDIRWSGSTPNRDELVQPSDRLFGRAPGLGWAIDMGVILRLAKIRANCCGVMDTRWTPTPHLVDTKAVSH